MNPTRQPEPPHPGAPSAYRGRIAPTPSGWLHLGHYATFHTAWERARRAGGRMVYRTEDLDPLRCRPEFAAGAMEDLRWCGLDWDEGPDLGGPCAPYVQSERLEAYWQVFAKLVQAGLAYPCPHSRRQIEEARPATSPANGEALFPAALRPPPGRQPMPAARSGMNWRLRVADGRATGFMDGRSGQRAYLAGRDFGDFIIWKKDGFPAYELAVVVDDHLMGITEVVRGEDLLVSTARQILLYEALGWPPPAWYHCPLVIDPATGERMSKTHKSMSLRQIRAANPDPANLRALQQFR